MKAGQVFALCVLVVPGLGLNHMVTWLWHLLSGMIQQPGLRMCEIEGSKASRSMPPLLPWCVVHRFVTVVCDPELHRATSVLGTGQDISAAFRTLRLAPILAITHPKMSHLFVFPGDAVKFSGKLAELPGGVYVLRQVSGLLLPPMPLLVYPCLGSFGYLRPSSTD